MGYPKPVTQLPPPDPHESLGMFPESDQPMPAPVAFYLGGVPSDDVRRVSDAILALRPGALVVFPAR
jgi:hypothetical protein